VFAPEIKRNNFRFGTNKNVRKNGISTCCRDKEDFRNKGRPTFFAHDFDKQVIAVTLNIGDKYAALCLSGAKAFILPARLREPGIIIWGAKIVPHLGADQIRPGDLDFEPGDIIIENGRTLIVAGQTSSMVSFFDIGNGEECSPAPDAMLARVTKWKIVHKPLDEYEEIYSHPVLPG
jgi:hypothetical protein